ncbi:MAG: phage tail assembly protein [Parvibaculaceae bacterium]|nr:phage tail assembly protein [Parvibaculaceae bacterium]
MTKPAPQSPKTDTAQIKTVTLNEPIFMGVDQITSLTIRRPKAGEMRGLNMVSIAQMDVDSFFELLPRISSPILPSEVIQEHMDIADLVACMKAVSEFFEGKS